MALDTVPQTATLPDVQKWTGYTSCAKLPFEVFLDCLFEEDYSKLVFSGTPTPDELRELWIALYSEFLQESGGESFEAICLQQWQRTGLAVKIGAIKKLFAALKVDFCPEYREALKIWGYIMPESPDDEDAWQQAMNRLEAQIKGVELQLSQLDTTLDSMQTGKSSRRDFERQMMAVSKYVGFNINTADITTLRAALYLRDFREYCERQQEIVNNG